MKKYFRFYKKKLEYNGLVKNSTSFLLSKFKNKFNVNWNLKRSVIVSSFDDSNAPEDSDFGLDLNLDLTDLQSENLFKDQPLFTDEFSLFNLTDDKSKFTIDYKELLESLKATRTTTSYKGLEFSNTFGQLKDLTLSRTSYSSTKHDQDRLFKVNDRIIQEIVDSKTYSDIIPPYSIKSSGKSLTLTTPRTSYKRFDSDEIDSHFYSVKSKPGRLLKTFLVPFTTLARFETKYLDEINNDFFLKHFSYVGRNSLKINKADYYREIRPYTEKPPFWEYFGQDESKFKNFNKISNLINDLLYDRIISKTEHKNLVEEFNLLKVNLLDKNNIQFRDLGKMSILDYEKTKFKFKPIVSKEFSDKNRDSINLEFKFVSKELEFIEKVSNLEIGNYSIKEGSDIYENFCDLFLSGNERVHSYDFLESLYSDYHVKCFDDLYAIAKGNIDAVLGVLNPNLLDYAKSLMVLSETLLFETQQLRENQLAIKYFGDPNIRAIISKSSLRTEDASIKVQFLIRLKQSEIFFYDKVFASKLSKIQDFSDGTSLCISRFVSFNLTQLTLLQKSYFRILNTAILFFQDSDYRLSSNLDSFNKLFLGLTNPIKPELFKILSNLRFLAPASSATLNNSSDILLTKIDNKFRDSFTCYFFDKLVFYLKNLIDDLDFFYFKSDINIDFNDLSKSSHEFRFQGYVPVLNFKSNSVQHYFTILSLNTFVENPGTLKPVVYTDTIKSLMEFDNLDLNYRKGENNYYDFRHDVVEETLDFMLEFVDEFELEPENISIFNLARTKGTFNDAEISTYKAYKSYDNLINYLNLYPSWNTLYDVIEDLPPCSDQRLALRYDKSGQREIFVNNIRSLACLLIIESIADKVCSQFDCEYCTKGGDKKLFSLQKSAQSMNLFRTEDFIVYEGSGDFSKFSTGDNILKLKVAFIKISSKCSNLPNNIFNSLVNFFDELKDRRLFIPEYLLERIFYLKLKFESYSELDYDSLSQNYIYNRAGWPQGYFNKLSSLVHVASIVRTNLIFKAYLDSLNIQYDVRSDNGSHSDDSIYQIAIKVGNEVLSDNLWKDYIDIKSLVYTEFAFHENTAKSYHNKTVYNFQKGNAFFRGVSEYLYHFIISGSIVYPIVKYENQVFSEPPGKGYGNDLRSYLERLRNAQLKGSTITSSTFILMFINYFTARLYSVLPGMKNFDISQEYLGSSIFYYQPYKSTPFENAILGSISHDLYLILNGNEPTIKLFKYSLLRKEASIDSIDKSTPEIYSYPSPSFYSKSSAKTIIKNFEQYLDENEANSYKTMFLRYFSGSELIGLMVNALKGQGLIKAYSQLSEGLMLRDIKKNIFRSTYRTLESINSSIYTSDSKVSFEDLLEEIANINVTGFNPSTILSLNSSYGIFATQYYNKSVATVTVEDKSDTQSFSLNPIEFSLLSEFKIKERSRFLLKFYGKLEETLYLDNIEAKTEIYDEQKTIFESSIEPVLKSLNINEIEYAVQLIAKLQKPTSYLVLPQVLHKNQSKDTLNIFRQISTRITNEKKVSIELEPLNNILLGMRVVSPIRYRMNTLIRNPAASVVNYLMFKSSNEKYADLYSFKLKTYISGEPFDVGLDKAIDLYKSKPASKVDHFILKKNYDMIQAFNSDLTFDFDLDFKYFENDKFTYYSYNDSILKYYKDFSFFEIISPNFDSLEAKILISIYELIETKSDYDILSIINNHFLDSIEFKQEGESKYKIDFHKKIYVIRNFLSINTYQHAAISSNLFYVKVESDTFKELLRKTNFINIKKTFSYNNYDCITESDAFYPYNYLVNVQAEDLAYLKGSSYHPNIFSSFSTKYDSKKSFPRIQTSFLTEDPNISSVSTNFLNQILLLKSAYDKSKDKSQNFNNSLLAFENLTEVESSISSPLDYIGEFYVYSQSIVSFTEEIQSVFMEQIQESDQVGVKILYLLSFLFPYYYSAFSNISSERDYTTNDLDEEIIVYYLKTLVKNSRFRKLLFEIAKYKEIKMDLKSQTKIKFFKQIYIQQQS
eukprot:TRINITY_DN18463_c0_g2_i1.p1 TRINITY_DN18463_c0_g2~~TRINITY_DN18463_c0_g2_i1.p1  ORF type:complete len:2004 (-),score=40.82 TRINITY_DN18463_c0_g2_i1:149-6160(-)